jgi:hypothetical protein
MQLHGRGFDFDPHPAKKHMVIKVIAAMNRVKYGDIFFLLSDLASVLKLHLQLQLNVAVAFTPPQIPEAKAVMVAGAAVVPRQVATPLASTLEFTEFEVVQFTSVSVRFLSDACNRQVAVAVEFS